MELRWLGRGDEGLILEAGHLFDETPDDGDARRFLAQPNHHLCIASIEDAAAGFVSGIVMTHPDKGDEMFLYELGVDDPFRSRGVGGSLVRALASRAEALGCYGMWTLTDESNLAARATYRSAGAHAESPQLMLDWDLDGDMTLEDD